MWDVLNLTQNFFHNTYIFSNGSKISPQNVRSMQIRYTRYKIRLSALAATKLMASMHLAWHSHVRWHCLCLQTASIMETVAPIDWSLQARFYWLLIATLNAASYQYSVSAKSHAPSVFVILSPACRCKVVVQVNIIQRSRQSICAAFQCLWDVERDNYSYHVLENDHVHAWCCVFGIYYD